MSELRVAQPVMRRSMAADTAYIATPMTPVTMSPAKDAAVDLHHAGGDR